MHTNEVFNPESACAEEEMVWVQRILRRLQYSASAWRDSCGKAQSENSAATILHETLTAVRVEAVPRANLDRDRAGKEKDHKLRHKG